MPGTLKVEIVTPEAVLWSGEATALLARSSVGQFTVLAQHTEMVGDLEPGLVRVETSEGERGFVVHGGFFQVETHGESDGGTRATVLAGVAEAVTGIDVARASIAKESAESVLVGRTEELDDEAVANAKDALARAELRLALAR